MTTSAAQSLWLDTAPPVDFPVLTGDLRVDVAVLGGGIAGLSTALLLKRRGARVAVLEAARVGRGVTGCTTAKVSALQATVYSQIRGRHGADTAATYAEASLAGVERLGELAAEVAPDAELERRPAFTYAPGERERSSVEEEAEAAREAGLPVQLVDGPDVPYPVSGAVRLDDQLQLHPVRYVQGLAAAVAGDGSHVFERTRARSVEEGAPCRVRTAGGDVVAEHVVVATHYPILDRGLFFARLEPTRSYCVAARLAGGTPRGMSISAGSTTRSVRSYRDLLIVGGEGHAAGSGDATPERFARLEAFAREHWDVRDVTHRWSAQDPTPYDHLPFVGPYRPGSARLWVTAGFMKWGLATATFAAMALADRIDGRESPWATAFSPTRLSVRSTPGGAKLGVKFGADLVGDRLRPPQALRTSTIRAGEARVVRDGLGGKKGVFRDDDGTLHAVSLRCTHMGCLVRFNAAERSWDCPCHGSRFDVDGSVLEGPAVAPLEPRDP